MANQQRNRGTTRSEGGPNWSARQHPQFGNYGNVRSGQNVQRNNPYPNQGNNNRDEEAAIGGAFGGGGGEGGTRMSRILYWVAIVVVVIIFALVIGTFIIVLIHKTDKHCVTDDPECNDKNDCTVDFCCKNGGDEDTCHSENRKNWVDCDDQCMIPDTGLCWEGECVGTCKGQCDSIFDINPPDSECPSIDFVGLVDSFGLFIVDVCFVGECLWFVDWGPIPEYPCISNGHQHELSQRGARHCLDFVKDSDPNKPCLEALMVCLGGNPVCVYTYQCSRYVPLLESGTGTSGTTKRDDGASSELLESKKIKSSGSRGNRKAKKDDLKHEKLTSNFERMSTSQLNQEFNEAKEALGGKSLFAWIEEKYETSGGTTPSGKRTIGTEKIKEVVYL